MIKKKDLSNKDRKVWEDYIKDPSDIYDKEKNNFLNQEKHRFKFDLHGFNLDEANRKVKEIILFCREKKYKELLLVTGKGIHSTNEKDSFISKDFGKLKYSVPEFLNSNRELRECIVSINNAELRDGGEGAIIIKLKRL